MVRSRSPRCFQVWLGDRRRGSPAFSFSPDGTATTGSVYLESRDGSRFAVRVLGATARIRIERYVTSRQGVGGRVLMRAERRTAARRTPARDEPLSCARLRAGGELTVVDISDAGALVESPDAAPSRHAR